MSIDARPGVTLAAWRTVDDPAAVGHARSGAHVLALVNDRWEASHAAMSRPLNETLRFAIEDEWTGLWAARPRRAEPALERLAELFTDAFDVDRERHVIRGLVADLDRGGDPLRAAVARVVAGWGGPATVVGRVKHSSGSSGASALQVTAAGLPFPLSWYSGSTLRAEYIDHMVFLASSCGVELPGVSASASYDLDRATVRARTVDSDTTSGMVVIGGRFGAMLAEALGSVVVAPSNDAAALVAWGAARETDQAAWLTGRTLYELGPYVSEDVLVRNSAFFAGRVLGRVRARPREDRLASLLKTVFPRGTDNFYRTYSRNLGKLRTARGMTQRVATAARHDAVVEELLDAAGLARLRDVRFEFGDDVGAAVSSPTEHNASSVIANVAGAAERRRAALCGASPPTEHLRAFSTSVSYRNSTNSVTFPVAMLSYPMLGEGEADLGDYAYFGGVVGHELAHAIVPREPAEVDRWCRQIGIDRALDAERPDRSYTLQERRELLCDALGFRWAVVAAREDLSGGGVTRLQTLRFLSLWATRFRGSARHDGRGSLEVGIHPSPALRCGVALAIASNVDLKGNNVAQHFAAR